MYGEILFCASLTSSNVGMYIVFSFFVYYRKNSCAVETPELSKAGKLKSTNAISAVVIPDEAITSVRLHKCPMRKTFPATLPSYDPHSKY